MAAVLVGALVFGSGQWRNTAVLFAFFLSSVVLSRIGRARKRALVDVGKAGARDAAQVLANGLVAAVCAVLAIQNPAWQIGFAAAFAAATADTWATEIGTLVRGTPHSILTGKPIATGLSGGITLAGTTALLAGAVFIALVARQAHASNAVAAIAVGGVCGALMDSLLGATVQALRYCTGCGRHCETDPHICGADTTLVRGAAWMSNDGVNFLATATGAGSAMALTYFFPYFFSR
ncbi:MAG: DUF92 domain-containing protein [Candidatus Eremiobacteraeota bacterium]|nr:DUF92 domain-containing protein [Candidatus Eremiobacteraeota bacterium]